MNILLIGRGSMGKRRIRDLEKLGHNVSSWDIKDGGEPCLSGIDAIVISTPPDHHNEYIEMAVENDIPCFVEASVILGNLDKINRKAKKKGVLVCPSCTYRFDKNVQRIKEDLKNAGKLTNFSFHLGQYLPDWHPYQKITDFYVGKKETSGAREMVTFEWTWLFDLFGFPKKLNGFYGKTLDMGADIDDTYVMSGKFKDGFGTMVIDVVARHYIKTININCADKQIRVDWKKVDEGMYLREMEAFISAIQGNADFPNTLDDDIKILKLLENFEKSVE